MTEENKIDPVVEVEDKDDMTLGQHLTAFIIAAVFVLVSIVLFVAVSSLYEYLVNDAQYHHKYINIEYLNEH